MRTNTSIGKLARSSITNLYLTVAIVMLAFLASVIVSYYNIQTLRHDTTIVLETHEVLTALDNLFSQLKDAETGQRGFLLTGKESYLEPYTEATSHIDAILKQIALLIKQIPAQQDNFNDLQANFKLKLNELAETILVRRKDGYDAALAIVLSDRGKSAMDKIRDILLKMKSLEQARRSAQLEEMSKAYDVALGSGLLMGLIGILLSGAIFYILRKNIIRSVTEKWLQSGRGGLAESMIRDQNIEQLADSTLKFVAEYLGARAAAFFSRDDSSFKMVSTYAAPVGSVPAHFDLTDGLLGQAAKDGKIFILEDIPEGYLATGSAFGQTKPSSLIVLPLASEGQVNAVIEFGFLNRPDSTVLELVEGISETIGNAVRSSNDRFRLQNLLEETQRQSEELQTQSEELRVSNEELEEQSKALRESQSRLELQQVELEQNNAQLEEQAQILEAQKDEVSRSKVDLQIKAQELEQASQYKSDFLANMSHELRTPLNSTLILAKLLAENKEGNLSSEQVRFAETIHGAGNDLLTLINEILDLSKIEAGHMQIRPEEIPLSGLVNNLSRLFGPLAEQKKVNFITRIAENCPRFIESDSLRLEQVLKNLLSNALKFTEKGEVEMSIECVGDNLQFSVRDTGIGIPANQQQIVFEAFRQADGTTNRKYGGTGLGLSISRQLTRLLGGKINLKSELGKGSLFTVTLPIRYDASAIELQIHESFSQPREPSQKLEQLNSPVPRTITSRRIADDRETLTSSQRIILVIEDDEQFAKIMYELARESGFQCLVANTAEEGLSLAAQTKPNAIILDIGLPDNSGLSVLDRLKRDARTRHIPVHVVSAHDHSQTALSLGAVGYMLKPVERADLVKALGRLENKLNQRLRRVLIVEDDKVQLESLQKLLGSHDVETVGAATAADCLKLLTESTFDCMVLDLTLPDTTGFSLLETLSNEDRYAFPPVIVYTGRDLSYEQEEKLRRYSKSIIIKGAKSPERLLDEVTLFLHQVVSELPPIQQKMLERAQSRDALLEKKQILVVEDDVRNVFAITSILEPRGAIVKIARNGKEAVDLLQQSLEDGETKIDLVLMDIMMPEMDGISAMKAIRAQEKFKKLPIIALTAKAMKDDQEQCLAAGANDYMSKPLDVEKLLSLVRVWIRR